MPTTALIQILALSSGHHQDPLASNSVELYQWWHIGMIDLRQHEGFFFQSVLYLLGQGDAGELEHMFLAMAVSSGEHKTIGAFAYQLRVIIAQLDQLLAAEADPGSVLASVIGLEQIDRLLFRNIKVLQLRCLQAISPLAEARIQNNNKQKLIKTARDNRGKL